MPGDWYTEIIPSMFGKKHRFTLDEFFILEVFLAAAAFGLLCGVLFVMISTSQVSVPAVFAPAPTVETDDEYHAAAKDVMAPFFAQAITMKSSDIAVADPTMRELAKKTQDRLLRLDHIPKSEQTTHLSCVLLLGQWLRALDGSVVDALVVHDKTVALLKENPWLQDN